MDLSARAAEAGIVRLLNQLQPGNRMWVKIPAKGYVSVGILQIGIEPASSFTLNTKEG